jgi:C4-dicarboxylate transporter
MSLKSFHLVFMINSILLMLILCGWSYTNYRDTQETVHLAWSGLSAAAVVAMIVYGRYFLKKLKHISYL